MTIKGKNNSYEISINANLHPGQRSITGIEVSKKKKKIGCEMLVSIEFFKRKLEQRNGPIASYR